MKRRDVPDGATHIMDGPGWHQYYRKKDDEWYYFIYSTWWLSNNSLRIGELKPIGSKSIEQKLMDVW